MRRHKRVTPDQNPDQAIIIKEQYTPKVQSYHRAKKRGSRTPTERCPGGKFKEISEETQAGYIPATSENIDNQTRPGTERFWKG